MYKNMIGENIAKYRKELNMTQEDLAKAVGVSTQAVSKWECGGTPDVLLLPSIAEKLKVSIDALYGMDKGEGIDVMRLLEQEICRTPEEERLERVCSICWELMKDVCCHAKSYGKRIGDVLKGLKKIERVQDEYSEFNISTVFLQDESGIMMNSIAKDYSCFLVMPEPESGYESIVRNEESFLSFFNLIAKENVFKVLIFIYSCNATIFTADYIASKIGLDENEVGNILDELQEKKFLYGSQVSTSSGVVKTYTLKTSSAFIPFLYFTSMLMSSWNDGVYIVNDRESKLLKGKLGEGNPVAQWVPENSDGYAGFDNILF